MGWGITPTRNGPDDPVADDYLVWSSIVDAPIFRGNREAVTDFWLYQRGHLVGREQLGAMFEEADKRGASSALLGYWDDRIQCMETPGGPGMLPRANMRAFADAVFPPEPLDRAEQARRVTALLEPFEDNEEGRS